ncbi:MAG: diadenylate cyclase CdaA [Chitinophagales bacterium]|nr:diadenylate cyclase CdaA [Chitinophagales bacterium]
MLDLLIKIGFLEISVTDLLDILLVTLLLFQLYKLLRGSLAFNIFIGLVFIYILWFLVTILEMQLLKRILEQFVNVGVLALLIIFQPEARKFLLYLGRGSVVNRTQFLRRLFNKASAKEAEYFPMVKKISLALGNLKKTRTGAIIVLSESSRLQFYAQTGVLMDSMISSKLIESIFEKGSPLHDGAMIISDLRIVAAGCVLPVSDNPDLPSRIGMRHKATVGISELSDALAIVVSEEKGSLSYAKNGQLFQDVPLAEMNKVISQFYSAYY